MFEYFPNNYPWSLAVMGALSRGGQVSEVDDACRPLREIAAKKNDPAAQAAWFESWMKVAERVERLADIDAQKNHPLTARQYREECRAWSAFLIPRQTKVLSGHVATSDCALLR